MVLLFRMLIIMIGTYDPVSKNCCLGCFCDIFFQFQHCCEPSLFELCSKTTEGRRHPEAKALRHDRHPRSGILVLFWHSPTVIFQNAKAAKGRKSHRFCLGCSFKMSANCFMVKRCPSRCQSVCVSTNKLYYKMCRVCIYKHIFHVLSSPSLKYFMYLSLYIEWYVYHLVIEHSHGNSPWY